MHNSRFSGTLVVDREQWEIFPEKERGPDGLRYKIPSQPAQVARQEARGLDQHTDDFIQCMRSRARPRCDVHTGSLAAVNAHLGNIALRTGEVLDWHAEKGRFDGNRAANALLKPDYRRPWRLPDV